MAQGMASAPCRRLGDGGMTKPPDYSAIAARRYAAFVASAEALGATRRRNAGNGATIKRAQRIQRRRRKLCLI